jgi:hypothetical protein
MIPLIDQQKRTSAHPAQDDGGRGDTPSNDECLLVQNPTDLVVQHGQRGTFQEELQRRSFALL